MAALRENGTLNNTVIVVTADQGELCGEHGLYEHTSNLYLPVLHVPLIVRYPSRVPSGCRVTAPVSLRDLAATLTDLSGLTLADPFPGVSLAAHFPDDGAATTTPVFAAVERGIRSDSGLPFTKGAMQSLLDRRWQLIRTVGMDERELYDYRADRA